MKWINITLVLFALGAVKPNVQGWAFAHPILLQVKKMKELRTKNMDLNLSIVQPILNSFYFHFQEVVQDEEILWIIDIIDKTTVVIFSIEYGLRWSSCQAGGRRCCPSGCSAARSRPSSSWRRWTWSTSSPSSPSTSPSGSSPSRTSATSARRARSSVWSRSPETKTLHCGRGDFMKKLRSGENTTSKVQKEY